MTEQHAVAMTYWAARLKFVAAAHLWHPGWLAAKPKLIVPPTGPAEQRERSNTDES